ncbi:nucleobase:cation symporter-2 family protein [Nocardiopsis lambiniae]|uniref:Nucleobase:cation symporter-2 family protein n=1 Tax=Nocardiopsis lambiniae TaxID=3075539 RepID=A0ABU2M427_9ACTN|nr:nucleobase:cation symporter-2 family protein [Nocardiopsis sp. DSM 44743]MDT0327406.1 nucleobase:cation symporter-2 family protein [Nocardiopsis sp. DSM 44743]
MSNSPSAKDPATTNATLPSRPEDAKPPLRLLLVYGMQHILTMYAGAVAPALVIGAAAGLANDPASMGVLVSGALLVAGIATLLQTVGHRRVGAQMPIVVAASFVPVSAITALAAGQDGENLPVAFGASLAAGVFALCLTPFFGQLIRFFPPVVTGTIITVIGISLMPVAARWIMDGGAHTGADGGTVPAAPLANLALAGVTLAVVLIGSRVLPGVWGRLSVLLGMLVGTLVALPLGMADFSRVGEADIVFDPTSVFYFGPPRFEVAAIVTMCVIMLVVLTEGASHIIAVGEITGSRVDAARISAGLRADVSGSIIGPILNSTPTSSFAQNIGLLALTGVRSRYVVAVGAGILVLLGMFPILGGVMAALPAPVLGGAGLVLFGSVAASGVKTLAKVDFGRNLNLVLVAAAFGVAVIPLAYPGFYAFLPASVEMIAHSGIIGAAVVAILLNVCFNVIGGGAREAPAAIEPKEIGGAGPGEAESTDQAGAAHRGKDAERP